MNEAQVIRFSYQQSLAWKDGPGTHWSETVEASVTLLDYALSSGWLRENFTGRRGGANDFLVLMTIVMHARPLDEPDLSYLTRLNLACAQDAGRLYARVTDLGLGDELGMHRTTIAVSTQRLADMGFITIAEIPDSLTQFRDSHGRFEGAKIYLLSGDLQERLVAKNLKPKAAARDGLTDTEHESAVSHRDSLSSTVAVQTAPTVSVKPTYRVGPTYINIEDEEEEEVFKAGQKDEPDLLSSILARFIELHGGDYASTTRDKKAVQGLIQDGYSLPEILAGMERAAANLDGTLKQARSLAYCVPEIRRLSSQARQSRQSGGLQTSETNLDPRAPQSEGRSNQAAGSVPAHVLTVFAQAAGRVPSSAEQNRLVWLCEEFGQKALEREENAWEWIADALKKSPPDTRQPLAYIRAVLARRAANQGRPPVPAKPDAAPPPSAALMVRPEDAAVQLGGLVIEKPKPRRSGYVLPGELAMGYLYDFVTGQTNSSEEDLHGQP